MQSRLLARPLCCASDLVGQELKRTAGVPDLEPGLEAAECYSGKCASVCNSRLDVRACMSIFLTPARGCTCEAASGMGLSPLRVGVGSSTCAAMKRSVAISSSSASGFCCFSCSKSCATSLPTWAACSAPGTMALLSRPHSLRSHCAAVSKRLTSMRKLRWRSFSVLSSLYSSTIVCDAYLRAIRRGSMSSFFRCEGLLLGFPCFGAVLSAAAAAASFGGAPSAEMRRGSGWIGKRGKRSKGEGGWGACRQARRAKKGPQARAWAKTVARRFGGAGGKLHAGRARRTWSAFFIFSSLSKLRYTQKLSRTNGRAKALIPWVKCVITGEASCEKEMPFQAAPFVLGTAGATAVGAGAWHVLTGNSCDSWRTCAGSRKHTMLPERTGSEIAASLYHPTGPGHGNVQGDGTHTGQLSLPSPGGGARPQAPAPAPRACPLSSLSCCADRRCGRAQAFRRGWST